MHMSGNSIVKIDAPILRRILEAPSFNFPPLYPEREKAQQKLYTDPPGPSAAEGHNSHPITHKPHSADQEGNKARQPQQQRQQQQQHQHQQQQQPRRRQLSTDSDIEMEKMGINLQHFKGHANEDPEEFIEKYEAYSNIKADTDPAKLLPLFLSDQAYQWYATLDPNKKKDFAIIKKLFLERYKVNEDIKFSKVGQLFEEKQKPGEKAKDFIARIRKDGQSVKLPDDVQIQAILNGLDPEIKPLVILQKPKTLEEIETAATLVEASQGGHSRGIVAAIDDLKEQMARMTVATAGEGRNNRQHSRSRSRERTVHFQRNQHPRSPTPHQRVTPAPYRQQQQCYNCNYGRCGGYNCKAKGKTCFGCGRIGHFRSKCRSARSGFHNQNY